MARSTQTDRNLDFNGQAESNSTYKELGTYRGNAHKDGFRNPDMIQEAQMPNRKGNEGKKAGPVTAKESKNPVESGRREWKPEAGQNYVGNSDKIHKGNPITRGNPKG